MKRSLVALAIVGLFVSGASAQEVRALNLAGLQGTYVLTVIGDTVTLAPLRLYSPTPGPTPTPDPAPDQLTERARALRDAALKCTSDPERIKTTQLLALLYAELGKRVEAGEIKGREQITAYAKAGADVLLDQRKAATAWQPFRETLSAQWVKLTQEGGTDADFARLLNEVSDGLSAAAPEPQALDLKQMIELIMLILAIIQKLFPMGG